MTNKEQLVLMEVNRIFKTLDYDMKESFDSQEFYHAALISLNRCLTIKDCEIILNAILQFQRLFKPFVHIMVKPECLSFYRKLKLVPLKVNYVDEDDDDTSKYIVSNALTLDNRKFYVSNKAYNGAYQDYVSRLFTIAGVNYYAEIPHGRRHTFNIYDKKDNSLLVSIKLRGGNVVFTHCQYDMFLVKTSKVLRVYRSSYIHNLSNKEKISDDNAVAYMDFKMLKHVNDLGVVRYHLLDQTFDKEMLDFLAIAYLVLSRKK